MQFNETDETAEIDIEGIEADIEDSNSRLMSTNPAQDELAGFNVPVTNQNVKATGRGSQV